jgi:hypothetical protein
MSPVRQTPKSARFRKVSYIQTKQKETRYRGRVDTGGSSGDDGDRLPAPNPRVRG